MSGDGRVRAAIVGAGLMGRWHARAARRAGAEVIAVVDPDVARAEALAAQFGARACASLADAGRGGSLQVAHICVPLENHVRVAREALEIGVHTLVEKPLAPTAAETDALLRAAAEKGLLVCPVHQLPFQRGMRSLLRARVRIGPLLHVRWEGCSAGASSVDERDRVAGDILPHPLSVFAAVLDAPLATVDWAAQRTGAGELTATGRVGSVGLSVLVSMGGRPTTNALRIIGEGGTGHADLFHGFAVVESGGVSRARKVAHPFTLAAATLAGALDNLARRTLNADPAYPGLRELVADFYAGVSGGTVSPELRSDRTLDIALARDAVLARLPSPRPEGPAADHAPIRTH